DGKKIVITCPSERFFAKLCEALDVDWVSDPRFENIDRRLENQDELDRVIGARCMDFSRDELIERIVAADV
ncbi:MAG: CoA transferase, partial [Gemmatimonadetes bacterium]|nr:CoA transferase [Gemmatimonadota bacterium]